MMITTVRYTAEDLSTIVVDEAVYMNWPSNTHWDVQVQAWLDEGNTIEPYDEYYGITDEIAMANNAAKARTNQEYSTQVLAEDDTLKAHNVPRRIDDTEMAEHEVYISDMQAVEENPPSDPAYEPPLPPGVTIPDDFAFTLTITREPGWNDVMGWRAVMTDLAADHSANLASLSLYSAAQCSGFLYTTGAFTDMGDGTFETVCPAGQEPGDADINFGVTYSGVDVECKTLPQAAENMTWEVNTA